MALSGEVGELSDILQWLTEEESMKENLNEKILSLVKEELADIFIYLIRIADKLDINIEEEVKNKIRLNEEKYPIHLSKNNATKYNRR
jgi:NTP pyrophosphatase (non-canonical NTP hydrolase)